MKRSAILYVCLCLTMLATAFAGAEKDTKFPTKFRWGKLVATEKAVELHVAAVPKNGVVALPPFNNPYKRIYLKSDAKKTQLKFQAEVKSWLVTLPKLVGDAPVVVIETVGKPQLLAKPFVNKTNEKGNIVLPAHHAIVHGEKLRYEPQPHKNTVGYWTVKKDWCEWILKISKPGKYAVHILQGCGTGHGGSEVEIKIGDSRVAFTVEDTGGFQNFKDRKVGTLNITRTGQQSLQIRPVTKAKVAVMDVRRVRLVPVP